MTKFRTIIKLFKINNWIKNLLILVPIFFSVIIPDHQMILELIILFFIFSLSASAIYIFNDIMDRNTDKFDLIKKNRPIASGLITLKDSILIILILMAIITICLILTKNYVLNIFILSYLLINIAYTFFFRSLQENLVYFLSPTEINNKASISFNKTIRIGGLVKKNSIIKKNDR